MQPSVSLGSHCSWFSLSFLFSVRAEDLPQRVYQRSSQGTSTPASRHKSTAAS